MKRGFSSFPRMTHQKALSAGKLQRRSAGEDSAHQEEKELSFENNMS